MPELGFEVRNQIRAKLAELDAARAEGRISDYTWAVNRGPRGDGDATLIIGVTPIPALEWVSLKDADGADISGMFAAILA